MHFLVCEFSSSDRARAIGERDPGDGTGLQAGAAGGLVSGCRAARQGPSHASLACWGPGAHVRLVSPLPGRTVLPWGAWSAVLGCPPLELAQSLEILLMLACVSHVCTNRVRLQDMKLGGLCISSGLDSPLMRHCYIFGCGLCSVASFLRLLR